MPHDDNIAAESKKKPGFDLKIHKIKTAKNKIPQRLLMRKNIIPTHPSSVIFNGKSGSGKSTLLANFLTRKEFFKDYYDEIYLISPTAASDDIFQDLKIPADRIDVSLDIKFLEEILTKQKDRIEKKKKKIHLVEKVLIIFDDCQSNSRYMKNKSFLKSFIANRHFGVSTWFCSQSFNLTPRACRLQANNLFIFKPSGSEMEILAKEFCPPGVKWREFERKIAPVFEKRHAFLHINQRAEFADRYRENLDMMIDI